MNIERNETYSRIRADNHLLIVLNKCTTFFHRIVTVIRKNLSENAYIQYCGCGFCFVTAVFYRVCDGKFALFGYGKFIVVKRHFSRIGKFKIVENYIVVTVVARRFTYGRQRYSRAMQTVDKILTCLLAVLNKRNAVARKLDRRIRYRCRYRDRIFNSRVIFISDGYRRSTHVAVCRYCKSVCRNDIVAACRNSHVNRAVIFLGIERHRNRRAVASVKRPIQSFLACYRKTRKRRTHYIYRNAILPAANFHGYRSFAAADRRKRYCIVSFINRNNIAITRNHFYICKRIILRRSKRNGERFRSAVYLPISGKIVFIGYGHRCDVRTHYRNFDRVCKRILARSVCYGYRGRSNAHSGQRFAAYGYGTRIARRHSYRSIIVIIIIVRRIIDIQCARSVANCPFRIEFLFITDSNLR